MPPAEKKTIVYTYGVFDLLHSGHIALLKEARALGDFLVVGIFTDKVVEGFKRKPVMGENERLEIVKNLKMVDSAMLQDDFSPKKNIVSLKPDIVAKGPGAGWEKDNFPIFDGVKSVFLNYHPGTSTSGLIKKIKEGN
jgi:rfaE bifunctional protein nucleotidyltransferase chain/domain